MANTRCLLISLLVVLAVTSTLTASTKKRRQGGPQVKQAPRPIVQHYYPPIQGLHRSIHEQPPQQGTKTRQIQQWQIAVNVPPGSSLPQHGSAPPSAPAPGHIWIQVPVAGYPQAPAAMEQPVPAAPAEVPSAPAAPPSAPAAPPSAPSAPPAAPAEEIAPPPAGEEETTGNEIENVPTGEGETAAGAIGSDPEMLKHCQEPRGQFPSPTECNKFFNCWDGYVAVQSCPGDLLFSDQGPFCDYPENVDCSERGGMPPPPPPPATEGEQGGVEAGQEEEEGSNGLAPGNETGAGGDEEEEQVSEQELAENVGEGCKEPYARYRSPKNCGIFIVCVNSRPVLFRCPPTLHYNEEYGVCDYPYRVDCGTAAPAPQEEGQQGQDNGQEQPVPEEALRYYGGFAKRPPVHVATRYFRPLYR